MFVCFRREEQAPPLRVCEVFFTPSARVILSEAKAKSNFFRPRSQTPRCVVCSSPCSEFGYAQDDTDEKSIEHGEMESRAGDAIDERSSNEYKKSAGDKPPPYGFYHSLFIISVFPLRF